MNVNTGHQVSGKCSFFVSVMFRINRLKYGVKALYVLFLFLTLPDKLSSQHTLILEGKDAIRFGSMNKLASTYLNVEECREALLNARFQTLKEGYLEVSIDSLTITDSVTHAWIWLGDKYQWLQLKSGNVPEALLAQARLRTQDVYQQPLDIPKMKNYFNRMVTWLENHGYPFASIFLDSIQNQQGKISAVLNLDQGPLIKLDSVKLNEDAPVHKSFLLHYLSLKEGAPYEESKITLISTRLRELSFLQEASPWRVSFHTSKTKLHLDLKNKNANRADILIGLLPSNDELQGKFLLTGDVKLAFINALNHGESMQLNWQNLQYKSPRYDIKLMYPYVLNTNIGLSAKFDFYKKDTSFKSVQGELGLLYQINATDYAKLYYELASTRVGNVNVNLLKSSRALPSVADVTYKTIGMEWVFQNTDYRLNPKKGFQCQFDAGLSFRKFLRNATIEETLDPVSNSYFSYLYDSIPENTIKYQVKGSVKYYYTFSKRYTLAAFYAAGYTFSSQQLFKNELFQIGGYRLLRGFDEGALFVNNYHIITLEPRFQLSLNSYFFVFGDVSRISSVYYGNKLIDYPRSVGAGMAFETKAGLFNMSYAVGSRNDSPFQLRNSKIHFGYVSLF